MWWRRREPEPVPEPWAGNGELDRRVEDSQRRLAESRAASARARRIAEESRRLVERNSIARLVRDSIVHPQ